MVWCVKLYTGITGERHIYRTLYDLLYNDMQMWWDEMRCECNGRMIRKEWRKEVWYQIDRRNACNDVMMHLDEWMNI